MTIKNEWLIEVDKLNIFFQSDKNPKPIHAVRDLSFTLKQGEMLGVVGESGSGKSITNLALMGILGENSKVQAHLCQFNNRDLLNLSESQWQEIRGKEISMIFQDPMTALNPFLTVEFQIVETILAHTRLTKKVAREKAIDLLSLVGIPSPKERMKAYPFELSGGMAQRVMIAMAISTSPKLLIADEPTTALDVTIQKQILMLLKSLQEKNNMSIILVTHDLGVVSEYSDRVQVMYAGEIIESGDTKSLISHPHHPYTKGLLASRPGALIREAKSKLPSISGIVPAFHQRPSGCQFHPRCPIIQDNCSKMSIALENNVRCLYPLSEAHP
ncbi:MAG: ABC transporter ATP-binding protein [Bacteriovorax sp.]|jgi:dipeptide transport system ATP-binding protein|nr:ABC transporter ATP-binding protein [Bacteriovorax sp.]